MKAKLNKHYDFDFTKGSIHQRKGNFEKRGGQTDESFRGCNRKEELI